MSSAIAGSCSQQSILHTRVFSRLDTNGDSKVSRSEFNAAAPRGVSIDQAGRLFEALDINKSGMLSISDLIGGLQQLPDSMILVLLQAQALPPESPAPSTPPASFDPAHFDSSDEATNETPADLQSALSGQNNAGRGDGTHPSPCPEAGIQPDTHVELSPAQVPLPGMAESAGDSFLGAATSSTSNPLLAQLIAATNRYLSSTSGPTSSVSIAA